MKTTLKRGINQEHQKFQVSLKFLELLANKNMCDHTLILMVFYD